MAHSTIYVMKDMIQNLTGRHIVCYNCCGDFAILEPVSFESRRVAYYVVEQDDIPRMIKRGVPKDKILITDLPQVGRDKMLVRRLFLIGEKRIRILPIGE